MKTTKENLEWILIVILTLMIIMLSFATRGHATPSGGFGQPFFTMTQQGERMILGKVDCADGGTAFLTDNSKKRESIIFRNISDATVVVCPTGKSARSYASNGVLSEATCVEATGFPIASEGVLILDKGNAATSGTGWTCYGAGGTKTIYFISQED